MTARLVASLALVFLMVPFQAQAQPDTWLAGPLSESAGFVNNVSALIYYNGRIVAGGSFLQSLPGQTANNIVSWNGIQPSSFGSGMNSTVFALETFKYPGVMGDYELIAGGAFDVAGGLLVNFVARWDEDPIAAFPPPAWQPMGAGFNNAVYAIKRHNGQTYAAGAFTHSSGAVSRIARWNEATDVWEPLGLGMNDAVFALESYGGYLYAGGQFTSAGGVSTGGLARWDGAAWSQVGGYFLGSVHALEIHEGQLAIGGLFPGINSSPNIAHYDGFSYSTYGTGGTNAVVRAIASLGGRIYLGGDFSGPGAAPTYGMDWGTSYICYWDGSAWNKPTAGPGGPLRALLPFQGELNAAGDFTSAGEPLFQTPGWARYLPTGIPWMASHPSSQSVASGANVTFTAIPAAGYGGLELQWYRFNTPLADSGTPVAAGGSTIGGAQTTTLSISNVSSLDAGRYTLVASNASGADTSAAALLTVDGITDVSTSRPPDGDAIEMIGPNPTAGSVRVTFSLAREADTRVRVHDVSGRKVAGLPGILRHAGRHQESWDGRGFDGALVQSGIYFVTLEVAGRQLPARSLVVLR